MKKIVCILLSAVLVILTGCTKNTYSAMTITVFEAGKADAILIETEEGSVLIDAGLEENKDDLLDQLAQKGIESLDALIITHFDKDHAGGADAILENLDVSHVYTTYQTKSSDDIDEYEEALRAAGLTASVISGTQAFTLGGAVFEMYGASGSYKKDESNNSSLIIRVTFGKKSYLFTGDAQDERILEFLASGNCDADFLKVPYHGHMQDTLPQLIEAVSPETAVITNGEDEPSAKEIIQTVSLLEEFNASVYQTVNGTVVIACTREGFTVSQQPDLF